jgi:glycosyltransferase involved in cell wall biosynthesis
MIRVRFVYRNYKKPHTIHASMLNHPPEGIKYFTPDVKSGISFLYPLYSRLRGSKLISRLVNQYKDIIFQSNINSNNNTDLLHYVQYVPNTINHDLPYVIDFEHVIGFTDFMSNEDFFNNKVIPFLINDQCKGIIAHSYAAKSSLMEKLGDNFTQIEHKVKVIYPALPAYNQCELKNNTVCTFLFVGNHIYRKGLHELLFAFDKLPKHTAKLNIISNVPRSIRSKYTRKDIHFFQPTFSHDEILTQFFCNADVFIMPTHRDSFGMVFLDAMSCGTPVIGTNQFALPEIINNNENGIILTTKKKFFDVPNPVFTIDMKEKMKEPEIALIDQLYDKIIFCINNPEIIKGMGINASKLFINPDGKFSIEKRNSLLKEVYEKALGLS